ncbi:hypothetical protein PybrP1_003571 [[Pythium] brassicae (nom. inval.)]|nr:hypothetical protein PybrP1_003571 [[Pythium] brassicae (nom. inval.)]
MPMLPWAFNNAHTQIDRIIPLTRISIKVGRVDKISRTNLRVRDSTFTFDPTYQGYEYVSAQANELVGGAMQEFGSVRARALRFCREAISSGKRDPARDSFPCTRGRLRNRWLPSKAPESRSRRDVPHALGNVVSAATSRHNTPLPALARFRQMQHLDAMRPANGHAASEPEFRSITIRLNWSSDLQLSVNVRELREALGLPLYSLVADGIFSPTRSCRRHGGRRPLERMSRTPKAKTHTHAFDNIFLTALVQTVGTHLHRRQ